MTETIRAVNLSLGIQKMRLGLLIAMRQNISMNLRVGEGCGERDRVQAWMSLIGDSSN